LRLLASLESNPSARVRAISKQRKGRLD